MNKNELTMLQALPLDIKIAKSRLRLEEFIRHMGGEDKVYISFSGGKDSTVLLHFVRTYFPNVEAVFSDTGLEFPELRQFANTFDNLTVVRPKENFKQVIEEYGYPMISKKTSRMIRDCQNPTEKNAKSRKLYLSDFTLDADGNYTDKKNGSFKIAKKWRYLIDAPFKISNKCCDKLKKEPLKTYEKLSKKKPIIGTMANESKMREQAYMQVGCNNFREGSENCCPFGFWTEQDIYNYILKFNLEIAPVYGEIVEENGMLTTTKEKRTGCVFCGYCKDTKQLEDRYLRLEQTHPQLHTYCMDKLGFKEVCEYMGIKYSNKEIGGQISIDEI